MSGFVGQEEHNTFAAGFSKTRRRLPRKNRERRRQVEMKSILSALFKKKPPTLVDEFAGVSTAQASENAAIPESRRFARYRAIDASEVGDLGKSVATKNQARIARVDQKLADRG